MPLRIGSFEFERLFRSFLIVKTEIFPFTFTANIFAKFSHLLFGNLFCTWKARCKYLNSSLTPNLTNEKRILLLHSYNIGRNDQIIQCRTAGYRFLLSISSSRHVYLHLVHFCNIETNQSFKIQKVRFTFHAEERKWKLPSIERSNASVS